MKRNGKKHAREIKAMIATQVAARIDYLKAVDGTNQSVLAKRLGITQPRMSSLRCGKLEQFSLDAMVQIAVDLGLSVHFRVTRPYRGAAKAK
jgi:predicted XRE-type DNA-binding protein